MKAGWSKSKATSLAALHVDGLIFTLVLSVLKVQHGCVLLAQKMATRGRVNVDGSVVHGLVGSAAWRAAVKHLAVLNTIMCAAAAAVCPDVLLLLLFVRRVVRQMCSAQGGAGRRVGAVGKVRVARFLLEEKPDKAVADAAVAARIHERRQRRVAAGLAAHLLHDLLCSDAHSRGAPLAFVVLLSLATLALLSSSSSSSMILLIALGKLDTRARLLPS